MEGGDGFSFGVAKGKGKDWHSKVTRERGSDFFSLRACMFGTTRNDFLSEHTRSSGSGPDTLARTQFPGAGLKDPGPKGLQQIYNVIEDCVFL